MQIEKIWQQYQAALKGFLHAKVSNEADVDDLMQEILIKSHQNLATVNDPARIKSWLFQVAHNTIIDFYRQKGRRTFEAPQAGELEQESEAVQHALSACVLPFIDALPHEQAQLLKAIDIENQSQKAYAERQQISYSTLKSRVQKSRIQLKQVFDQCCHFEIDSRGKVYDYERKTPGCDQCN